LDITNFFRFAPQHKEGGRVATMVMYCDVPEKGGYTNFMQAGVTAKPELGAAAFFSYMDPKTKIKDTGYTTHSGCPVIEGTKRIAVHWMRVGVDAENPWDSFNTRKFSIQRHVLFSLLGRI
jgi:2OG-Fe(II) oxygenase superfamily